MSCLVLTVSLCRNLTIGVVMKMVERSCAISPFIINGV